MTVIIDITKWIETGIFLLLGLGVLAMYWFLVWRTDRKIGDQ